MGFRGSNIQKSGEAVKRLDRLSPALVHVCGFIWEWTLAKYKSPHNTPGGIVGFLGGHKFKCLEWGICETARPIGTKFGTCLQIRLGMDIAKYNSPLNTTGGISGGG